MGDYTKRDEKKRTKKESSLVQGDTANPCEGTAKEYETRSSHRLAKDGKIGEFSIKRPDDEAIARVGAILVWTQNIIVADTSNEKLKLFDLSGVYLSSVDTKYCGVWGITAVTGNRFATCGSDTVVRFWALRGKAIVTEDISYKVDHESQGIHYNGTYYCLLDHPENAITVLDTQGRQVRKIVRKEVFGKGIQFGLDIHMDKTTHHIYVPCFGSVLCLSLHNDMLWFTPLAGILGGITEIDGELCISDFCTECVVYMISKTGEYNGQLLDKNVLKERNALNMCYVADARKLFLSLQGTDIICFKSL